MFNVAKINVKGYILEVGMYLITGGLIWITW